MQMMERWPFMWHVSRGWKDVVEYLLEKGADVNSESKRKRASPLLEAMESDNIEIIKLLVDHGRRWKQKTIQTSHH